MGSILLGILFLYVSVPLAQAQRVGRFEQTDTNIGSYYYYVLPGTPTMQVHVLGTVRDPGLYEISVGTNLGQLLALSGGPVLDARQRNRRRTVVLRLFRFETGVQELLYEQVLDHAVSRPELILREGDVLSVEVIERQGISWRDVASVLNVVAVLVLAVDRLR